MNKRILSLTVILAMIAVSFFSASDARQPAFVGVAQAAPTSLAAEAGISAYANVGSITPDNFLSAFLTIEYKDTSDQYLIGRVDVPIYEPAYDPFVLVHTDGWIVAFYPNSDPAGKLVDVIGKTLEETLLEKAVKIVGAAGGLTVEGISHYDFRHPVAGKMLLVAEDKADGNAFTLSLPSTNTYAEKSYAFYQNWYPSFTLDNEFIDEVSFVLTNADYVGPGVYGTIYGHFADPAVEPGWIDFETDIVNTFSVWSESLHAFGTLAILYEGEDSITVADKDFLKEYPLVAPAGLPEIAFDLTPSAPDKVSPANGATGVVLNPTLDWADSTAPNYEYCIDTSDDDDCDTSWVSTPAGVSQVDLSNLMYETTYYWQVRAVNSSGPVDADGGDWWSFTTADGVAPVPFAKDEAATVLVERDGSASKLTMVWEPSYGAYYYEYCIDTAADCTAPELWHNVGLALFATDSNLEFDTTYYWQVRAWNGFDPAGGEDTGYYTYADGAWSQPFATRTFSKLRPTYGALHSPSLPLEWEPSGAAESYEYCVSEIEGDCHNWTDVGTETKATVRRLKYDTTYYWQVRAVTGPGTFIEANDGYWWTFTTTPKKIATPTLFKVSPEDGVVDQLTTLLLDWKDYKLPSIYQFCFFDVDDTDTTPISDDDDCTFVDSNWVTTGDVSEAFISGLSEGTTYYWQVRANIGTIDDPVYIYADRDEYWSFTTAP